MNKADVPIDHYAFGSVSDWIHTNIGGLSPAEPGWKHVKIAPTPGGNITHANSKFISPYGEVSVRWHIEHDDDQSLQHRNGLYLEIQIPPNTKATVSVPNVRSESGVQFQEVIEVGSGFYEWFVAGFE